MGNQMPEKKCDEVIMLTEDGCPACDSAKEELKDELERGEIKIKRSEEGEGKKIADELGVSVVPTFVCKRGADHREMEFKELETKFPEKEEASEKKKYQKERIIETDGISVDIDTEGMVEIKKDGKEIIKLARNDLKFISKVTEE